MKKFAVSAGQLNAAQRSSKDIEIGKSYIRQSTNPIFFPDDLYEKIQPLRHVSDSTGLILYYNDPKENNFIFCQESMEKKLPVKIKIEPRKTLAAEVAYEKKPYFIEDPIQFARKNPIKLDMKVLKNSIYCFPILNTKNEVLMVVELYRSDGGSYSDAECEYFQEFAKWCGLALEQTQNGTVEKNRLKLYNVFTDMFHEYIYSTSIDFYLFMHIILTYCKNVIQPSYITVHDITTTERNIYVAELFALEENGLQILSKKVVVPRDSGFVYSVIQNCKQVLAVAIDKYNEAQINKITMEYLKGNISYVLYVPVTIDNEIIVVFALVNGKNTRKFTQSEEQFSQIVASYIQLAYIFQNSCHKVKVKLAERDHLLEILEDDLGRILKLSDDFHPNIPIPQTFYKFPWFPQVNTELISTLYFMMTDLCPNYFKENKLKTFLIGMKNSIRYLVYHNFIQTILDTHFVYLTLKKIEVNTFLPEEIIALMLFSISKTMNFNGLDNDTISLMKLPITTMVTKKFIQYTAFESTKDLLEKTKLLDDLPKETLNKTMKFLSQYFLDPANSYFHLFENKLKNHLRNPNLNIKDQKYRYFKICLIIWSSCHCRYLKKFDICSKLCENFHSEQYNIGDIQKKLKLKTTIAPEFDRQNASKIPAIETEYIEHTVLPIFESLNKFFPQFSDIIRLCRYTQQGFQILKEKYQDKKVFRLEESYLASNEFENYDEIKTNNAVKKQNH